MECVKYLTGVGLLAGTAIVIVSTIGTKCVFHFDALSGFASTYSYFSLFLTGGRSDFMVLPRVKVFLEANVIGSQI